MKQRYFGVLLYDIDLQTFEVLIEILKFTLYQHIKSHDSMQTINTTNEMWSKYATLHIAYIHLKMQQRICWVEGRYVPH